MALTQLILLNLKRETITLWITSLQQVKSSYAIYGLNEAKIDKIIEIAKKL